jgi:hypothetical protein
VRFLYIILLIKNYLFFLFYNKSYLNFYILQFLHNNFTKILRYEEENQNIHNNYAERRLRRGGRRADWIEIKKFWKHSHQKLLSKRTRMASACANNSSS